MLYKQPEAYYQSTLLQKIPGIFHAYSSRQSGDMRSWDAKSGFLKSTGKEEYTLVWPQQVHGTKVHELTGTEKGEIALADGLVYKKRNGQGPIVAVFGADCVPMLFVDPVADIIGAAHAGWKGTLGNIAQAVIQTFVAIGSDVKNIHVSIGPYIGMCCYTVPPDRAAAFQRSFGNDSALTAQKTNTWHLDIGYANVLQLQSLGVQSRHIDIAHTCTSCEVGEFFSFRKDAKERFGEIMGVIHFVDHS